MDWAGFIYTFGDVYVCTCNSNFLKIANELESVSEGWYKEKIRGRKRNEANNVIYHNFKNILN